MKVFVSWSGDMSKQIAQVLNTWLPRLIQAVEVFYSPEDIEKGENWDSKLTQELANCNYGIICLTPENKFAPWLHFEAGAIANTLDSRVSTLLVDLKPSDIKGPLSRYQATKLEKTDFSQLIFDINKNLDKPLERDILEPLFDTLWPSINEEITRIKSAAPTPEEEEKEINLSEPIEEILQLLRKQNTMLSDPSNLLPENYFAYLHKNYSSTNSRKTEEIISDLLTCLQQMIDRADRYREDYNILILHAISFDEIFAVVERYFSKCSGKAAERYTRRYMDIRDHYYYLLSQAAESKK